MGRGTGRRDRTIRAALAAMLMGIAAPAAAQQAQDTLRIATSGQIASTVAVEDPQPNTHVISEAVFDGIVCYEPQSHVFRPLLAQSWTEIDDLTIEFHLRPDVTFQDGSPLTAADVVYSYRYMVDPTARLRFGPQNFDWMARVEAIDAHTVRLVAKRVDPLEMLNLAILGDILPAKLHGASANRSDFGRLHPVGSGPYKVAAIDQTHGVTLVRNPGYRHGNGCKPAGSIATVRIVPIPDPQTRMAELVTGGTDLIRAGTRDEADALASNPALALTAVEGTDFTYLQLDALARSGNRALADRRVRQAIVQAIDRGRLARSVLPGGAAVRPADALCTPLTRACAVSVKPYPYDPAAARRLLAAAGYPDGFSLAIDTPAIFEPLSEAIAGELRKVGIVVKVDEVTVPAFFQHLAAGKVEAAVSYFGLADVASNVGFFFGGGLRDYWRDPAIGPLVAAGEATLDTARRRTIYRQIFDRMNAAAYILPLATTPDVFIHVRGLAVPTVTTNTFGLSVFRLRWQ